MAPDKIVPPVFVADVFLYHWYVNPVPEAVTDNAVAVPLIQMFCATVEGCDVITCVAFIVIVKVSVKEQPL